MTESICEILENSVRKKLASFGLDFSEKINIGVAVSGGADSIALLTSLVHVLPQNIVLKAVTVNHNIRASEETEGDAAFVQNYCEKLGVGCTRFDIPRGKVEEVARNFDCGVEDAARRLRYESFEAFSNQQNVKYICLAHNRNDQVETVLMRFLSGGDSVALGGIPPVRDKFWRPMIEISREEIEAYLHALKIPYRTDKTNFDTAMLRNKIRHRIMPMLDLDFPGWRNSVYNLSNKIREDACVVENLSDQCFQKILFQSDGGKYCFSLPLFENLPGAVKRRIVYKIIQMVGPNSRVPYHFVDGICHLSLSKDQGWKLSASGVKAFVEKNQVVITKESREATETCFFVTIEESGFYVVDGYEIEISQRQGGINLEIEKADGERNVIFLENLCFPFIFRSRQSDDEILTSTKSFRSVNKILEDWKCPVEKKDLVPLIQELSTPDQFLVAILGSLLGYRDWIVKSI